MSDGCELLILVKDREKKVGDPIWDTQVLTRGDVIEVRGIGWPWGECELGLEYYTRTFVDYFDGGIVKHEKTLASEHPHGRHSFWRIVRFTNVRLVLGETLMAPELSVTNTDALSYRGTGLHHKGFYLDVDAMDGALKRFMEDDSRAIPMFVSAMNEADFRALIRQKAAPGNRIA